MTDKAFSFCVWIFSKPSFCDTILWNNVSVARNKYPLISVIEIHIIITYFYRVFSRPFAIVNDVATLTRLKNN